MDSKLNFGIWDFSDSFFFVKGMTKKKKKKCQQFYP